MFCLFPLYLYRSVCALYLNETIYVVLQSFAEISKVFTNFCAWLQNSQANILQKDCNLHCKKFRTLKYVMLDDRLHCRKYLDCLKAHWAAENACWLSTETRFSFALRSFT